jgi:hypothetical protein
MTKDEIIRLAREAGYEDLPTVRLAYQGFDIQRFANLVAAHKAEVALAEAYRCGYEAGAVVEREECAKVCAEADKSTHPADLADAIRARGNT